MSMWKVRALNTDGELTEHHVEGDLSNIAKMDFGGPVMVVQRDLAPREGQTDQAKGSEAMSVKKEK